MPAGPISDSRSHTDLKGFLSTPITMYSGEYGVLTWLWERVLSWVCNIFQQISTSSVNFNINEILEAASKVDDSREKSYVFSICSRRLLGYDLSLSEDKGFSMKMNKPNLPLGTYK